MPRPKPWSFQNSAPKSSSNSPVHWQILLSDADGWSAGRDNHSTNQHRSTRCFAIWYRTFFLFAESRASRAGRAATPLSQLNRERSFFPENDTAVIACELMYSSARCQAN